MASLENLQGKAERAGLKVTELMATAMEVADVPIGGLHRYRWLSGRRMKKATQREERKSLLQARGRSTFIVYREPTRAAYRSIQQADRSDCGRQYDRCDEAVSRRGKLSAAADARGGRDASRSCKPLGFTAFSSRRTTYDDSLGLLIGELVVAVLSLSFFTPESSCFNIAIRVFWAFGSLKMLCVHPAGRLQGHSIPTDRFSRSKSVCGSLSGLRKWARVLWFSWIVIVTVIHGVAPVRRRLPLRDREKTVALHGFLGLAVPRDPESTGAKSPE